MCSTPVLLSFFHVFSKLVLKWKIQRKRHKQSKQLCCKIPMDLLSLTTNSEQFFPLSLEVSIGQYILFLTNTWNIFFHPHVSPHKKGYKEMYNIKGFSSSQYSNSIIKNVPGCLLGQKTPVKTFWFDCYFFHWREKAVMRCKAQEMSLTAQDVRTKQEWWKEKPRTRHYPDIIQHLHRNLRKQTPD